MAKGRRRCGMDKVRCKEALNQGVHPMLPLTFNKPFTTHKAELVIFYRKGSISLNPLPLVLTWELSTNPRNRSKFAVEPPLWSFVTSLVSPRVMRDLFVVHGFLVFVVLVFGWSES